MPVPLISSLIALPLVGAVLLLFINNRDNRNERVVRAFALGWSVAELALTLVLWAWFNDTSADFQFVERHAWIPSSESSMPSVSITPSCCSPLPA